jgi:GAF domain-containing protein/nitrogen-specific signal transduction histidine kinase
MEGLGPGFILLVGGIVSFILVLFLLRILVPSSRQITNLPSPLSIYSDSSDQKDAIIIVQGGGRLEYLNEAARRLFGLHKDDQADLERLARFTRPSNEFLSLLSKESQKRISIGTHLTEATSYRVPGLSPLMMVVLRSLDFTPVLALGDNGQLSASILRMITDFGQSVSSSLDLEETIRAILENIGRLVSAETMELKVWDESRRTFIPYRYEGRTGEPRTLRRAERSYFGNYAESFLKEAKPLLLSHTISGNGELGNGGTEPLAVRSYLGIPLMENGKLVGVFEAGQSAENSFSQHDLELLQLVSGQAATAIRNALLYQIEQQRATELSSLANLAQAVSVSQDMKDLFEQLVKSVSPLFDVEILGFLLFDEGKRMLEGQVPFQGLPPHIVEIYRTSIPDERVASEILATQEPLLTLNAGEDERWDTLGIRNLAQAASLRDSALVPLLSGRRLIGFMQLSNHKQGSSAFSANELRLMRIVADQATAIIENAVLVQQARQRAYRSDALRRVASLSASAASIDEVLEHSLRELAHLFQADAAAIFLLDEQNGELRLHSRSIYGVEGAAAEALSRMFVADSQYRLTVSGSQKPFISGRLSSDRRILPVYRPLITSLRMESTMVVPLVVREHALGELMLGSRKPEFFNAYDLQVVTTAAGQLASALESARLINQTDENLRTRVSQLTAIMRISRELNTSLDVTKLLELVHDESLRTTGADCGAILLFEHPGSGDKPQVQLSIGCPVEEHLTKLLTKMAALDEPVVIEDFNGKDVPLPHENVRSALIVPIRENSSLSGIIYLHARQPEFFNPDVVDLVQTLAVQASIALRTASQYQAEHQRAELLRRRAETMSHLAEISYAINFDQPLEQQLRTIGNAIRASSPFQAVLFSIYEPDTGLLRRVTGLGFSQEVLTELLSRKQPLESIKQLLKPEFCISRSYFIPADQTPVVPADVHMVTLELKDIASAENAWDPDDFLLVPLVDAQGNTLGLLSLDAPDDGLRPDKAAIETLEIFAAQAALVITNTSRFGELRTRVETLSSGIQRQQRLLSVSQNDLPLLLRKDLEQTIAIHNLDRRAQRVRAGLAITESVSRQLDASSALLALGREVLTQLGMSVALVAEEGPEGPRLLHVLGSVPRATSPEALFGQRNPLRACLQTGHAILSANEDEIDDWLDSPLLSGLHAKAFICLPVVVQEKTVAAIMAVSPEPLPAFTDEDRQVYYQIARQTSVILQNISLLSETRRRLQEVDLLLDFSRQISGLTPNEIVTALLESARRVIQPAAHAGVVLLWDETTSLLTPRACDGYADNDSLMKIHYRTGEALPGTVFSSKAPKRVDELNFARDYALSAESLFLYRQATGGRLPISSLVTPIVTGGQGLGVLVLDNFNMQAAFKAEDETLLLSLTQQVALSLENVRLVQATEERAGQLQALNDVATTMTSSLRSEELTTSLLDQLRPVLPFDTATLLLRDIDLLRVEAARGFTDSEQRLGLTVLVEDSALFQEMIRDGQPISVADVRGDLRFPQIEAPRLSWLGIPLISKGEVIGVISLEKWQANFYTPEQIQVATTFAGQAAVALENARLYEDSVNRAAELDQRSQRLALLNRFSSQLSGLLDADEIQKVTAEELRKAFAAMRVSVARIDGQMATWIFSAPKQDDQLPQPLPKAPIFGQLRESLGVFTSDDFLSEPSVKQLTPMLGEKSASVLALPLISGGALRSILFIQLPARERLSTSEVELAITIANQASVALDSARLFQEAQRRAQETMALAEVGRDISATLDLEDVLKRIAAYAKDLLQVETSAVYLPEPEAGILRAIAVVGLDAEEIKKSPMMIGEGILGNIAEKTIGEIVNNAEKDPRARAVEGTPESLYEHLMGVPILSKERISGLMAVWRTGIGLEFADAELEFLRNLAQQAGVAIENARLFAETQRLAEELEQRVIERTAEVEREKANTETLLRILTEVSASLDLDRALSRTLALLNEAVGGEQGTIMLLHAEDNLLHYRAGYGYLTGRQPSDGRGFTLRVGEGLAGWVVETREATLVEDLYKDERWVKSVSTSSEHRSTIVAPLLVGEDVIGVLMVFHRKVGFFGPERLGMVKAIAGQVAIAINNAHLYELIRDQAERLGSMLRKEQEEASRSQAILEAVADGVVVTGPENRISFLNSSATQILGFDYMKVINQPLDAFGGIFGKAAGTWMQTINDWSNDPASYQTGDSYAEQLELDDGRIALVHLAPVILQNDFLGTVSIFRDITHEVEVDRLKSEFVATVSHELRTPMTSIRGYVDILLMGAAGALNENQTHFLGIVKNNTERLNILVNDLLDISRIEAGRVTLSPQPLDLRDVAEDVLADMLRKSQEENKPMAFSLNTGKDLPRIRGDAERVRQILGNLVDNAYHYTPENGQITVHLHSENGSEVQVDVEDSGVGISKEDQARIFDRFYRGEDPLVLATPGTGLGLAIVRQLVEMHEGRIWLKSEGEGKGSTFSFTLPVDKKGE